MKNFIEIDGAFAPGIDDILEAFGKEFAFPSYYGRNLDALFDCLTDITSPVEIRILHGSLLECRFGKRGAALLRLLRTAASESSSITLTEC